MAQRDSLAARVDRWARGHALALDVGLAGAGWLLFGLTSALVADAPGLVIATVTVLPLAVRRRYPTAVLAWSIAIFAVQILVVPVPLPANVAQAFVLYTVAAHVASLPVRLLALGAAIGGCVAGGFRWSAPPEYLKNSLGTAVFLAILATLLWIIGNFVRGREINQRQLHEANMRLEEGRRQREQFATQRERVSVAREVHDIVAHSLTVVIVQANGAEYAAEHAEPWDRADARAVLATIGRTARSALAEVRGVIDVLRDTEPLDASPGRVGGAELSQLVDSVRAAGLRVDIDAEPAAFDELPVAVRFALLRVVREALTNVLKHAGEHASACLVIKQTPDEIRVRITDDGVGDRSNTAPAAPGHGLDGMRERLRALDGTLSAGPRPGGFAVEASIPTTRRTSASAAR